jgi:hypothetical protein
MSESNGPVFLGPFFLPKKTGGIMAIKEGTAYIPPVK